MRQIALIIGAGKPMLPSLMTEQRTSKAADDWA